MPLSSLAISPVLQRRLALLIIIIMAISAILAAVFWMVLPRYGQWEHYQSAPCDFYCEHSHYCNHEMKDRPVMQQPVNAWTNLAYILAGLWPLIVIRVDISTVAYFLANLYCGISGFIYHASISIYWRHVDIAAMYTVCLVVGLHGVHAVTGLSWQWLAVPLLALGISFTWLRDDMDNGVQLFNNTMPLVFCACIASLQVILVVAKVWTLAKEQEETVRQKCQQACPTLLLAGIPAILAGLAIHVRDKDLDKSWCYPASFAQGHATWHCLTALASFLVWTFFDRNHLFDILKPVVPAAHATRDQENDDLESIPSKVELDLTDLTFDLRDKNSMGKDSEEIAPETTEEITELQPDSSDENDFVDVEATPAKAKLGCADQQFDLPQAETTEKREGISPENADETLDLQTDASDGDNIDGDVESSPSKLELEPTDQPSDLEDSNSTKKNSEEKAHQTTT